MLAKVGAVLRVALMIAAVAGGYLWWTSSILDFEPRKSPPGFRDLVRGGGFTPINTTATQLSASTETGAPADICAALFGDPDVPAYGPEDADVWIAYFTDANCTYCRLIEETLDEMRIRRDDVRVLYFDWPILGKGSIAAARASVAAARQRGYLPMHRRLMRSRAAVTPAYLSAITRDIGLEPDRLVQDLSDPRIDQRLGRYAAIARTFGFVGTPGLVVEGTVVQGAISRSDLITLIDDEGGRDDKPCPR